MIKYEQDRSTSIDYLYRQNDNDLNFGSHFHDSFEFIYTHEGEIELTIDGKPFLLSKRRGALVLPGQIHSYKTPAHSKTFILIFASNFVAKYYKHALTYCAKEPSFFVDDEALLKDLSSTNDPYLLKGRLYQLVSIYNQNEQVSRKDAFGTLIERVFSYLESNYNKPISLKTLASDLGYNYHYLSTTLNERLQSNFQTFLNQYRVNKFCELLMDDSSTPINELAFKCGYTSLRTFNRNFYSIKKTTPSCYRNGLLKEKRK